MTDEPMTVFDALNAVMTDVQAIKKGDRNTKQNYVFRGIDATVNAVGPALRKHKVVIVPIAEDLTDERFQSSGGAHMRGVTLRIRWRIYGPAGDSIEAVTYGESADSGDKAVPKAHSVAYRTVLLQALCIPTDDPEPDADSYERVAVDPAYLAAQVEYNEAVAAVKAAWLEKEGGPFDRDELADDFQSWAQGELLVNASAERLREYAAHLEQPEVTG